MDETQKKDEGSEPSDTWIWKLDERERAQVYHAITYKNDHVHAGVPGHGQFMLIAKLAGLLNRLEGR